MTFVEMLLSAQQRNSSMLCVGLDPDPARFPAGLKGDRSRMYDFCARIVDATADLAIAFKPQIAYFASHRAEDQLEKLMAKIAGGTYNLPMYGASAEEYAVRKFGKSEFEISYLKLFKAI
jgi:orotidine-5'-phosphate decarboxylase